MGAKRYELSDEQWEQIKEMFPRAKTGRPPKDNRIMMNAILWLARSGATVLIWFGFFRKRVKAWEQEWAHT